MKIKMILSIFLVITLMGSVCSQALELPRKTKELTAKPITMKSFKNILDVKLKSNWNASENQLLASVTDIDWDGDGRKDMIGLQLKSTSSQDASENVELELTINNKRTSMFVSGLPDEVDLKADDWFFTDIDTSQKGIQLFHAAYFPSDAKAFDVYSYNGKKVDHAIFQNGLVYTNQKGILVDGFNVTNFDDGTIFGYYTYEMKNYVPRFVYHSNPVAFDYTKRYQLKDELRFISMKSVPKKIDVYDYLMRSSDDLPVKLKQNIKIIRIFNLPDTKDIEPVLYFVELNDGQRGLLVRNDRQF